MSLLKEMFGLREAGIQNGPTGPGAKKRRGFAQPAPETDDPEWDEDAETDAAFGDTEVPSDTFDEPAAEEQPYEKPAPFASKSAPMPKTGPGIRISGDPGTLAALQEALQEAGALIEGNDDLADWCDGAWKALAQGIRRGEGSVSLPKFESVPEDLEPDEDEEGDY